MLVTLIVCVTLSLSLFVSLFLTLVHSPSLFADRHLRVSLSVSLFVSLFVPLSLFVSFFVHLLCLVVEVLLACLLVCLRPSLAVTSLCRMPIFVCPGHPSICQAAFLRSCLGTLQAFGSSAHGLQLQKGATAPCSEWVCLLTWQTSGGGIPYDISCISRHRQSIKILLHFSCVWGLPGKHVSQAGVSQYRVPSELGVAWLTLHSWKKLGGLAYLCMGPLATRESLVF